MKSKRPPELSEILKRFFPSSSEMVGTFIIQLDQLKYDAEFIRACKAFFSGNKDKNREKLFPFLIQWKVPPIFYWLVNDSVFKEAIQKAVIEKGAARSIAVYPWTTEKEILSEFRGVRRGNKRNIRRINWGRWRYGLIHYYFMHHSFLPRWLRTTPGDFARVFEAKNPKRRQRIRAFAYGDKKPTVILNVKETTRADQHLKRLIAQGIDYKKADLRAIRDVVKKRSKEARLAPYFRIYPKRAFETLRDLLSE